MQRAGDPERKRAGYVLLVFAVSSCFLVGFVGLGVDVGYLQGVRRKMQTAADAAAIGGALELKAKSANVVAAGRADAALNGFVDGNGHITVQINVPPTQGPWRDKKDAVEAIVTQAVPTMFMGVLGFRTVTVQARAVGIAGSGAATLGE